MRGGGTGASAPAAPAESFLVDFFTNFFLGNSVGVAGSGVAGVSASVTDSTLSLIDDSICAAIDGLGLTPICARETGPAGGVAGTGSSTERRFCSRAGGGEAGVSGVGGVGDVTVGVASSLAMILCASDAASSSSLSGVGRGSTAPGGLSCSFPAGLRALSPSATQQPTSYFSRYVRRLVSGHIREQARLGPGTKSRETKLHG